MFNSRLDALLNLHLLHLSVWFTNRLGSWRDTLFSVFFGQLKQYFSPPLPHLYSTNFACRLSWGERSHLFWERESTCVCIFFATSAVLGITRDWTREEHLQITLWGTHHCWVDVQGISRECKKNQSINLSCIKKETKPWANPFRHDYHQEEESLSGRDFHDQDQEDLLWKPWLHHIHNDEQGDVIWIRNGSHTIHICRKHEGIGIPVVASIISTCDMAKGTLARRGHFIFDQGNLLPHIIPQSRIISFLWTKSTHQNKKKGKTK